MVDTRSRLQTQRDGSQIQGSSSHNLLSAIETLRKRAMEHQTPVIEEIQEHDTTQILAANAETLQLIREGQQQMQQSQTQLLLAITQLTQAVVAATAQTAPPVPPPNVVEGNLEGQPLQGVNPPVAPPAPPQNGQNPNQNVPPVFAPGTPAAGGVVQQPQPQQFLTLTDVQALLQQEKARATLPTLPSPEIQPPYPAAVMALPYPEGYVPPKFVKFNGKDGSAQEHVHRFIETLGVHSQDVSLRLREFSKSLTSRAYTWYVNLEPHSVNTWEEMVNMFYTKFFQVTEKITSLNLVNEKQKLTEDIVDFIKRFQDKAVQCHEPVPEKRLVEICLLGMIKEYKKHLINGGYHTFSALMEAAFNIRGTVDMDIPKPAWKNKSGGIATAASQGGDGNPKRRNKPFKDYKERARDAPPYPCSVEEVVDLVNAWVADGCLKLPEIEVQHTQQDRASPRYCVFHRRVQHPTSDCWTLKEIFKKKQDNNELRISVNRDVRDRPYPQHEEGVAMAECCNGGYYDFMYDMEDDVEEVYMTSFYDHIEEIASYDQPAMEVNEEDRHKILSKSHKFRTFFDGLGFSPNARVQMTKAILEIASEGQEACVVEGGSVARTIREDSNTITFSDTDRRVPFPHNRPLFVTAYINGVELKRAFLDGGASINIMPLETLKKLDIPEPRIIKSLVGIVGFRGEKKPSLGYIMLDLAVGPIRAPTKFHVIEGPTNYHVILGRSWMHRYAVVPSSYHQCLKGIWARKKVTVPAIERPFEACEAHLSDAVYFSEVDEACEAITVRPVGVKIPKWENIKGESSEQVPAKRPTVFDRLTLRKITKTSEGGKTVYHL
ncbi:hypothetical protein Vadar_028272 [Vaccinium darrowii]|uniref:Uncharacterized protein n=1 Tax=Vaccinium darrowii TaxID=229202 RepID=A0ACB7Y274_9ERIC|nr:hypothetical protein Vadar_028272 [Vaccinium darrowii]